ncbi:MAG: hypothetical protein DMG00_29940 [Acidobacteria bacterium]|nr:MAG: hypothetical protein DMG00_29940 [Acidobacteriota bacterium]
MEILLGSSIWSDLVDPLCAFRDVPIRTLRLAAKRADPRVHDCGCALPASSRTNQERAHLC